MHQQIFLQRSHRQYRHLSAIHSRVGFINTTSNVGKVAQHAHPADRFAREILAILGRDTTRSQRLMRSMLARLIKRRATMNV
jgi:hypothetical protein